MPYRLFCPDALTPSLLDSLWSKGDRIVVVCPLDLGKETVDRLHTVYCRNYPTKAKPVIGYVESELPCEKCIKALVDNPKSAEIKWV